MREPSLGQPWCSPANPQNGEDDEGHLRKSLRNWGNPHSLGKGETGKTPNVSLAALAINKLRELHQEAAKRHLWKRYETVTGKMDGDCMVICGSSFSGTLPLGGVGGYWHAAMLLNLYTFLASPKDAEVFRAKPSRAIAACRGQL